MRRSRHRNAKLVRALLGEPLARRLVRNISDRLRLLDRRLTAADQSTQSLGSEVQAVEANQSLLADRIDGLIKHAASRREASAEQLLVLLDYIDDVRTSTPAEGRSSDLGNVVEFMTGRLLSYLEDLGLKEIEAIEGQPVDGRTMDVSGKQRGSDEEDAGRIADVVRRGFEEPAGIYRRARVHIYVARDHVLQTS